MRQRRASGALGAIKCSAASLSQNKYHLGNTYGKYLGAFFTRTHVPPPFTGSAGDVSDIFNGCFLVFNYAECDDLSCCSSVCVKRCAGDLWRGTEALSLSLSPPCHSLFHPQVSTNARLLNKWWLTSSRQRCQSETVSYPEHPDAR